MSFPADKVAISNLDLALAIGMKEPVRVWTQQISEGVQYEVQPRFAVASRDGSATVVADRRTS